MIKNLFILKNATHLQKNCRFKIKNKTKLKLLGRL